MDDDDRSAAPSGGLRALTARLQGAPRLAVAVLLLLTGVLVALTAAAPPATAPTLVTTRQLPAGVTLAAADVRVVDRPTSARPADAIGGADAALGRRVVGAVAAGEVVTTLRLAPAGFGIGLRPGRVVTAVAVAAVSAGVASPGDTVRLVAGPGESVLADGARTAPDVLTDDARVLAVWPGSEGTDEATVVVDVASAVAPRLAIVTRESLVGLVVEPE